MSSLPQLRIRPKVRSERCSEPVGTTWCARWRRGWDRLEWSALAALERIHDLAYDYINFLHPVRKLVSKTRSGPRVARRYDVASTPFHRLLDSGVLCIAMTRQLQKRSQHIDPYRLRVQIEHAQQTPRRACGFGRILT
jgi:hypothetical protein